MAQPKAVCSVTGHAEQGSYLSQPQALRWQGSLPTEPQALRW